MIKAIIPTVALTIMVTAALSQNRPSATYLSGAAKVSVWENQKEGRHGSWTEKNFKVEKIYKKDDKWETTSYFDLEDLLHLRAAIDRAIAEEAVKKE